MLASSEISTDHVGKVSRRKCFDLMTDNEIDRPTSNCSLTQLLKVQVSFKWHNIFFHHIFGHNDSNICNLSRIHCVTFLIVFQLFRACDFVFSKWRIQTKSGGGNWLECLLVHSEYKNRYIVFNSGGSTDPCPSPSPVAMCLCLIYSNAGWLCLCFKHTFSLEIIVLKKNISFTSKQSNYWWLYGFVVLVTFPR